MTSVRVTYKSAFWGLLMPVIILGDIYGGIFSATEAAAAQACSTQSTAAVLLRCMRAEALRREKYAERNGVCLCGRNVFPN